jgi:hypothetical protein
MLSGQLPPGTKTGMSTTSERRVITFLPPPLDSTSTSGTDRNSGDSRQFITHAYPSPRRSDGMEQSDGTFLDAKGAHSESFERNEENGYHKGRDVINLLSPPPSDDRVHDREGSSSDLEVGVDLHAIKRKYPYTKAARREVRGHL